MATIEAKTSAPSLKEEIAKTIETIDRIAAQLAKDAQGDIIADSLKRTKAQALKSLPEIIIWQRQEAPQTHQEKPQAQTVIISAKDKHLERALKEELSEKEPSAKELRIAEKEPIDLDNIEALEEATHIDGLKFHIAEIRKIPLQIEKHQQWGEEIFVGKISLLSLLQLSQCDLLSSSQKEKIKQILQKHKFLLSIAELTVTNTRQRLESNTLQDEKQQKLDEELMNLVRASEEAVNQQIDQVQASEDETDREQLMQQFIDKQINYANQGALAFKNLVEGNLRLALSIAPRYLRRGSLPLDDLIAHAERGLMQAAARWDYRRNTRFSTYAIWWIKQRTYRGAVDEGPMIRLPVHISDQVRRHRKNQAQYPDRHPSNEPLSEALASAFRTEIVVSLDQPLEAGSDIELGAMIPDPKSDNVEEVVEEITERKEKKEMVSRLLSKLPERERRVMELRFGINGGRARTLEEVGREFGVTRERIRQMEERALRKLKYRAKTAQFKEAF